MASHIFFETQEETRNATVYRDTTAQIEGAVLLTVAVIGGLGNFLIFAATAACSKFHTTACAFLSHHCILDCLKSIFCIPFACALLLNMDIPHCNALGATYIFLMTLTAYNLLAIHINEEYQLTNRQGYIPGQSKRHHHYYRDTKNSFWCVSFGIFMIWFTTVLLHLGVAFLPSSAEFNYDIGNCVFNYGTPKNYVIHVLWTILVTAALLIALVCFTLFLCKLRTRMHSEKWTVLHQSISREINQMPGPSSAASTSQNHPRQTAEQDVIQEENTAEELLYEFADGVDQAATQQMKMCLRRVIVMLLMVISFLLFWYPLFILTLLDVNYSQPPEAYRVCMIIAWTHPLTTPLFCGIIYFDTIHMESLNRTVYTAAIPMKRSTSFSSASVHQEELWHQVNHRYKMYDLGFTNENFYVSHHGSPSHGRHLDDLEELPEVVHRSTSCMNYDTEVHNLSHSPAQNIQDNSQEEQNIQGFHQTLIL